MSDKDDCTHGDEVVVTPGPLGFHATRHKADHTIEHGIAVPITEGAPLNGCKALVIDRIEGNRFAVLAEIDGSTCSTTPSETETASESGDFKGPAQVATPRYKANWDRIFGGKQQIGQA